MPVTVRVIDRDLGMKEAIDRQFSLSESYSKVGFPAEAETVGEATREGSGHKEYPDMEEVAFVAGIHEFGAPKANIPQRSFFRPALDESKEKFKAIQLSTLRRVFDKKLSIDHGLSILGEFLVARIKNRIRTGTYEPLKPETVRRKGSSKPLIDRAQMINSVTHIEYAK